MPRAKKVRMPKITQLPSGSYHAKVYSYTDDSGKDHYESFTDPDLAQLTARIASFKKLKKAGDLSPVRPSRTLSDCITMYIDSRRSVLSPTTVTSYDKIRRTNLQSIMQTDVDKLTQESIQQAVSADAARLSPKTVRNATGLLAAVLAAYRPEFRYRITLPQKEKHTTEIPTEQDVAKLLRAAESTPVYTAVALAALCGLRRSEIAALTWQDVNLTARTVNVHAAMVLDTDNMWTEKTTKTTESTRLLPIPPTVADILRSSRPSGAADTDHITPRPSVIDHRFRTLCQTTLGRTFNFHSLRHYFCSVMLRLGQPIEYIEFYLGHNSSRMIQQIYGHPMHSKLNEITTALDTFYTTQLTPPPETKTNQKQKSETP